MADFENLAQMIEDGNKFTREELEQKNDEIKKLKNEIVAFKKDPKKFREEKV